jgi:gliding motility-associated-like protein
MENGKAHTTSLMVSSGISVFTTVIDNLIVLRQMCTDFRPPQFRGFVNTIVIIIVLLCFTEAHAQKEADTWILGDGIGITFKSGHPEKINDGKWNTFINAVVSDVNGNLLFYTDGISVSDRSYNKMPNGDGLIGTQYFAPTCQIVPVPGNPQRYYIFTTHHGAFGTPFEAAYSTEVDLCLNNGLGDVVAATKNTPLVSPAAIRVAVVKHGNGVDYWVVFHEWNSDAFYAYKITSAGLDTNPVVSHAGSYLALNSSWSEGDGGAMKFSPDGKKLVIAIVQYARTEVLNFDIQNGTFSTPILQVMPMYLQNMLTPAYPSAAEFSPDGKKLYLATGGVLQQYDLSYGSNDDILRSRKFLVGDSLHLGPYVTDGLQLARDGRIYVNWFSLGTQENGISVIANPNESGLASSYQHNIIPIEKRLQGIFPSFPSSYFSYVPSIQNDFTCKSPTVTFSIDLTYAHSETDIKTVAWNFDDVASGSNNTSASIVPSHSFTTTGIHTITCSITWIDGTTTDIRQALNIPSTNTITYKGLGNDTTLCARQSFRLDASALPGTLTWQDGSHGSYFHVEQPGTYWFYTCLNGCLLNDSISIAYHDDLHISIAPVGVVCSDERVSLVATPPNGIWSGNSVDTQGNFLPENITSGKFTLKYTYETPVGCQFKDSIVVQVDKIMQSDIVREGDQACVSSPVKLSLSNLDEISIVQWRKVGSNETLGNTKSILITQPGTYYANISKYTCARETEAIELTSPPDSVFVPNVFSPNADNYNDHFEVVGNNLYHFNLSVINRYGKQVFQTNDSNFKWLGDGLPSGIYFWRINYINCANAVKELKGWVHLIR